MVRYGLQQEAVLRDDNTLYIILVGTDGQTKKLTLTTNKNNEVDFTTNDVGKVSFNFIKDNFIFILFR